MFKDSTRQFYQNIKQNYLLTGTYGLESNFGWICMYTNMSRVLAIEIIGRPRNSLAVLCILKVGAPVAWPYDFDDRRAKNWALTSDAF